jgi:hypothetical protein
LNPTGPRLLPSSDYIETNKNGLERREAPSPPVQKQY